MAHGQKSLSAASDIQAELRRLKRRLIRKIETAMKPHMWESGYRTGRIGQSRPLKLWAPKGKRGEPTMESINLGGLVVGEFEGITEDGLITDRAGGGIVTTGLGCLPVEDLLKLDKWIERRFGAGKPAAAH